MNLLSKIAVPIALIVLGLFLSPQHAAPLQAQEPSAPAVQNTCQITGSKTAAPTQVKEGGGVQINLEVTATNCLPQSSPVEVILVIDESGSMGQQDGSKQKYIAAREAANAFVDAMSLPPDRVGVVTFSSSAILEQGLTSTESSVETAIGQVGASGGTRIDLGLKEARDEFNANGGGNAQIVVLLSDGHSRGSVEDRANELKNNGVRIISVGLGNSVNHTLLESIASAPSDYYKSPSADELKQIYQNISSVIRPAARNLKIIDTLSDKVTLIPNSFSGPFTPTVNGKTLEWNLGQLSNQTVRLSYRVAMTKTAGTWYTNDSAVANYTDPSGNSQTYTFQRPQVTVEAACGAPVLVGIQDNWICVGDTKQFNLAGGGFYSSPAVTIGGQSLQVNNVSQSQIAATLSPGLPAGVYDVTVSNQCPAGAQSDTLTQSFNVYPGPTIQSVRPDEGYADVDNDITVCGTGFSVPGAEVSIIVNGQETKLQNQATYGDSCLVGTVPSGLAAGAHTIKVTSPCGTATAPYRVISASLNDDLWGQELFVDPGICVRQSDEIDLFALIHRRGGKNPALDVTVSFYEDSLNGTKIGDGLAAGIPPRAKDTVGGVATSAVRWTPTRVGEYTLYAKIDSTNTVAEDNELNNVISRTIRVLPPTNIGDGVAPRVDSLTLNGGSNIAYDQKIDLEVSASDLAQVGGTSSGLNEMNIVELVFNPSVRAWIPVASSGWVPYSQNYTWNLAPRGGLRYIQTWVSDQEANVSRYPNQQLINYNRSCTRVGRDQGRNYRVELKAGDSLYVSVTPCKPGDDPDLYIWPPGWASNPGDNPPFVANQVGEDALALPTSGNTLAGGTYQIEVYGYNSAAFDIVIEVNSQPQVTGGEVPFTTGISPDKPVRTAPGIGIAANDPDNEKRAEPILSPDSIPGAQVSGGTANVPPPEAVSTSATTYLPVVIK